MKNIIKEIEKYPNRKWIEIEGEIIGWVDESPKGRVNQEELTKQINDHTRIKK